VAEAETLRVRSRPSGLPRPARLVRVLKHASSPDPSAAGSAAFPAPPLVVARRLDNGNRSTLSRSAIGGVLDDRDDIGRADLFADDDGECIVGSVRSRGGAANGKIHARIRVRTHAPLATLTACSCSPAKWMK
jgi:hypothetical protein